ncbi:MAG: hypothetical protein K5657_03465 [Desulfovibrio sp.]|nr:hypothetical protein [Desulfovibrio sp.]
MQDLTNMFCIFFRRNKSHRRFFKLSTNALIQDIESEGHENERLWDVKEGRLTLYNSRNIRTSAYTLYDIKDNNGQSFYYFEGKNENNLRLYIIGCFNLEILKDFASKEAFFYEESLPVLQKLDCLYEKSDQLEKEKKSLQEENSRLKNVNSNLRKEINNIKQENSNIKKEQNILNEKISKAEKTAENIKNHLSYRLGATIVALSKKNIVLLLFLPFYLLSEYFKYKKSCKNISHS